MDPIKLQLDQGPLLWERQQPWSRLTGWTRTISPLPPQFHHSQKGSSIMGKSPLKQHKLLLSFTPSGIMDETQAEQSTRFTLMGDAFVHSHTALKYCGKKLILFIFHAEWLRLEFGFSWEILANCAPFSPLQNMKHCEFYKCCMLISTPHGKTSFYTQFAE